MIMVKKKIEIWILNNIYNRGDWCLNGYSYSREEWIEKLKEIGSYHYEKQKIYDG